MADPASRTRSSSLREPEETRTEPSRESLTRRRKVGRTLDPAFELPRGEQRQIHAVYLKNTKLALRSWITFLVFFLFEVAMVVVVGVILLSLGEDIVDQDSATFVAPQGAYTNPPRDQKQLGPAITWVDPSIRTEGIASKTGWGTCEETSTVCSGMIGSIDQPKHYKSDSKKGQLSIRFPFDETKPYSEWLLYPSFQQDDLKEFSTFEAARHAANNLIAEQLRKLRESDVDTKETGFNMFKYVSPWAVFALDYKSPAEQMYIPTGNDESICQDLENYLDYENKASHHLMLPRRSENIVTISTSALVMQSMMTLQSGMLRYTLSEQFSADDTLNKKYSYLIANATWANLPSYEITASTTNTAESIGMFIYPLVMLVVIIPNILYTSASEKQGGMKRMETLMGLGPYKRLLGDFLFYAEMSVIAVILMIITGVIFHLPFFVHTDVLFLILLSVATIIDVPLHGLFLSSFFSSGKSAALLGLLLIVVEFVFFFGLSGDGSYTNGWWNVYPIFGLLACYRSISEGVIQNNIDYWLTIKNMNNTAIPDVHNACVAVLVNTFVSMALSIIIYAPLGLYIENIMPSNRISRSWLYPLEGIVRKAHAIECAKIAGPKGCPYDLECSSYDTNITVWRIFHSIKIIFQNKSKKWLVEDRRDHKNDTLLGQASQDADSLVSSEVVRSSYDPSDVPEPDKDEVLKHPVNKTAQYLKSLSDVVSYQKYVDNDPDLKRMQKRALTGEGEEPNRNDIVRVVGLIKVYGKLPRKMLGATSTSLADSLASSSPTPNSMKVSVKGVSFTVRYDECFGLLGPNGAGKSTTLTILSGANKQSAGRILIDGIDTNYTNKKGRTHITSITGVCEQFDTLYGKLTVEEHLRHAAWIKGVKSEYVEEHVSDIIDGVGLTAQRKMRSANMSGGMQRRLSVGLAMVCSPKIIYFDEPTTGLDPETRRALWLTLMVLKRRRSLVLCTHSLDECEYLCSSPASNIAIMANGGLRGVGTAEYLKRRFGEGAKIQVMVSGNVHLETDYAEDRTAADADAETNRTTDDKPKETTQTTTHAEGIADILGSSAVADENKNATHPTILKNIGADDSEDENTKEGETTNSDPNGIHLTRNEQIVHNMISTRVNVSLVSAYCGTLTYNILNNEQGSQTTNTKRPRIAGVFRIMEQIAKECPAVTDWGVSLTSLESVFLNIVSASADCQV